jgi:hypothetical protein
VYSEAKAQLVSEFANAKTSVMGVDGDYCRARLRGDRGRRFNDSELLVKGKVCIIGPTARDKLFGNVDPIGRYVRAGRHPFLIIGTLKAKGQSSFEDQDDRILMPIGSWRSRVVPTLGDRVQLIMASAQSVERTKEAERQVRQILMQRHGFQEGEEPDFRTGTQEEFRAGQEAVFGVLTVLLLSVAGISLVVGGVGVMNIMLVAVTERTREIGIRMAIGARPSDIQWQFLLESVLLTLIGGAAGVGLAVVVMRVFGPDLGFPLVLEPAAVIIAFFTSVLIGLVFASGRASQRIWIPSRRCAMNRTLRSFWTAVIVAFGALRRSPLRATLTAFGILIGVAVDHRAALGEGASAQVSASIDSLGENAMIVQPTDVVRRALRADTAGQLTEADMHAIRAGGAGHRTSRAPPVHWRTGGVADANATASVIGTSKDFRRPALEARVRRVLSAVRRNHRRKGVRHRRIHPSRGVRLRGSGRSDAAHQPPPVPHHRLAGSQGFRSLRQQSRRRGDHAARHGAREDRSHASGRRASHLAPDHHARRRHPGRTSGDGDPPPVTASPRTPRTTFAFAVRKSSAKSRSRSCACSRCSCSRSRPSVWSWVASA